MSDTRFEEKIIYKTHQHWIVLVMNSLKLILYFALPAGILGFFFSGLSWTWGLSIFFVVAILVSLYDHYLWHHSWLMIGNQKITLSVRNGIFSQYAMNIRYRNIRDSAVSKNSMLGYFLKYGTLFVRSSANEWDFQAKFVPKVGKIYALVNALSRYSDDERARIHSVEELHKLHQEKEFRPRSEPQDITHVIHTLKATPGIIEVVELWSDARDHIRKNEEVRNRWVSDVLTRKYVIALTHDSSFREPTAPIVEKTSMGEVFFPAVSFPEVVWDAVISASPSPHIHEYLLRFFPYHEEDEATILVGWND
jgi:hypothetical protein